MPLVIAGDIPGHEIEYPMAIVILGGMVTSTLLNLFVVPSLYLRFGRSTSEPVSRVFPCRSGIDNLRCLIEKGSPMMKAYTAAAMVDLPCRIGRSAAEKPTANSEAFEVASARFEQNATDGDVEAVFEAIAGDDGLATYGHRAGWPQDRRFHFAGSRHGYATVPL